MPRSARRSILLVAVAAAGCGGGGEGAVDLARDLVLPGCGNGILEADEECDRGAANSDRDKDACRASCHRARCGDRVVDTGEQCDDGNALGGDGCTPLCTSEAAPLEKEPNNDPKSANRWAGGVIRGGLAADDRDCFSFPAAACASVKARLLDCPVPATLTLFDPGGRAVATGAPGGGAIGVDGGSGGAGDGGAAGAGLCATLDPVEAAGARFVPPGTWTLCVEGLLGQAVPFYALEIALVERKEARYPLAAVDDLDGDGLANKCDDDRDGDGLANGADNCPDTANGPLAPKLRPSRDGFLRAWLTVGAFTGKKSAKDCRPTDDNLIAMSDAAARPALGELVAGSPPKPWIAHFSPGDRVELLTDYGAAPPPRESYLAVYVKSAASRPLTLGVGPDDGARVFWNGMMVADITACQGTVIDSTKVKVTMLAGWNTLLIKVYDQGGGWGNFARFLDGATPVTDLELSLSPQGAWAPDQTDSDKDGVGDVCDKTPR